MRADLQQFKDIKNALGGTINDVVLAAVAGALGRYLHDRGELLTRWNGRSNCTRKTLSR